MVEMYAKGYTEPKDIAYILSAKDRDVIAVMHELQKQGL